MPQGNIKTNPSPARRLWTIRETSNILGVSTRSVWRLVSSGDLKSARLGRCVRVVASSVDEFIERGGAR